MEKKIIALTKVNDGRQCLICCKREAVIELRINRLLSYDDSVVGFHICDQCLAKAQQDIQKICE